MFSQFDGDLSWHRHTFEARKSSDGKYITIRLNDQIRGVVKKMLEPTRSDVVLQFDTKYEMQSRPDAHADGRFWLTVDETRHEFRTPQIKFYLDSGEITVYFHVSFP